MIANQSQIGRWYSTLSTNERFGERLWLKLVMSVLICAAFIVVTYCLRIMGWIAGSIAILLAIRSLTALLAYRCWLRRVCRVCLEDAFAMMSPNGGDQLRVSYADIESVQCIDSWRHKQYHTFLAEETLALLKHLTAIASHEGIVLRGMYAHSPIIIEHDIVDRELLGLVGELEDAVARAKAMKTAP